MFRKKGMAFLILVPLFLCLTMNISFAAEGVAKAELDQELAQMIGDMGTKVPGLGVIVFRDGQEVYSNFLGQAVIDEQERRTVQQQLYMGRDHGRCYFPECICAGSKEF